MFPSDYSDFKPPSTDPLKSQAPQASHEVGNNLKFFQEKIKEANQPNLSIHNKIHLLNDLKVKILQTGSTDVLKEVSDSLAQLQSEACSALSEQYELCKGMSEEDKMQLYTSIPEEDMEQVMDAGKRLIPAEMDHLEKVRILLGIQQLLTAKMRDIEKVRIINAFDGIPPEEIADVIVHALKLCTEKMNGFWKSAIIAALAKVTPAERGDVIDKAQMLCTEEMSGGAKGSIINALAKVPQEERADFASSILKFTKSMDGNDRANTAVVLAEVPQAKRGEIIDKFPKLFTETMSDSERNSIINAFIRLPQDEIINVIDKACRLFTEKMSDSDKNSIIKRVLIQKLSLSEKVDVIDRALMVFTESMDAQARISIIEALARLDKESRAYITSKGMSAQDILEFTISLGTIFPFLGTTTLLQDASILCDEGMTWSERITVLYVMKNISYKQEDLKEAEKHFTPDMTWREKLDVFLCRIPHLNLDESPKSASVSEEDFEDLIEGDLNLEDFFTPVPLDSIFADTDLIICKEDFTHTLPLNGIKLCELKEIEALALQIFSGSGKIKIDSRSSQFEKQVQGYIKTLLTRPIGRKLIKKVMESQHINSLIIDRGTKSQCTRSSSNISIELAQEGDLVNPRQKPYFLPLFIVLGHELIHASHPDLPSSKKKSPTLDPDYDNLEEQITISGFKKYEERDFEEEWDYSEENFDPINERNLHAAFANSKQLFYPRSNHKGYGREHILQDPSTAVSFVKARIVNHLTQSKLKAPLNLQKIYDKLITDALPS